MVMCGRVMERILMERPATVFRSSHIVVTNGAQGPHDPQAALQEVALKRRLTVNHFPSPVCRFFLLLSVTYVQDF